MHRVTILLCAAMFGCLPPPQPVENIGQSGPLTNSDSDATGSVVGDDSAESEPVDTGTGDTGRSMVSLQCHALAFDDDGHVQISPDEVSTESLFAARSGTIELWAWFSDETRDGSWLLVGMDGAQTWNVGIDQGDVVLQAGVSTLSIPMPENGWNHIAGVINGDSGELALYLNGTFSGRKEWNPPMVRPESSPNIHLGAWNTEGGSWPSAIDEVRFAQAVLHEGSSIDIGAGRPTDPWLGVWRFDDNLENEVSGLVSDGTDVRFTDSCP